MIAAPDSPSVSSHHRSCLPPAVSLLCALAFAAATAMAAPPPAAQQKPPPNAPTQPQTRSDTPGGTATSAEIAAAQQQVNDLSAKLHGLQTQMQDLKAQEPQPPGSNATAEEQKKCKQAHTQWQQQVDKLQHQIDAVTKQLEQAKNRLAALKAGRRTTSS